MAYTGTDRATPKRTLLSALGRQLVRHVQAASWLCYSGGLIAVILLPLLASNTHISENALMPGSGNPAFGDVDVVAARGWAAEVHKLLREPNSHRAIARWLVHQMRGLGADCYLHPFDPPESNFSSGFELVSHHFKWSTSNQSTVDGGSGVDNDFAVNIVGIVRAPQGDGNEAIVLVTPIDVEDLGRETALALGLGVALFAQLSKALWTARDIILVAADAKYGAYFAVTEWLKEYHNPALSAFPAHLETKSCLVEEIMLEYEGNSEGTSLRDFKRAGTIATGLVFEVSTRDKGLKIRAEGPNGQMPNLDLVNVLNSIAVWREGLAVQLDILPRLRDSLLLEGVGKILERISDLAKQLSSNWDFKSGAVAYSKTMATLLTSISFQGMGLVLVCLDALLLVALFLPAVLEAYTLLILGLATGAHGAFRDYQIDAISVQLPVTGTVPDYAFFKYGRLLEAVVRCSNNLLEKWHHSFFLYFLSAAHKYISVGVYMQPFALLLVGLPLTAAALCFPVDEQETSSAPKAGAPSTGEDGISRSNSCNTNDKIQLKGGQDTVDDFKVWLQALLLVSSIQVWSLFGGGAFYFISQTSLSANQKFYLWLTTSALSMKVFLDVPRTFRSDMRGQKRYEETQLWVPVKALTAGVTSIGLGVMSTINYAVALMGALILVPMCISVLPLKVGWTHNLRSEGNLFNILASGVGLLFTILGSLPSMAGLVIILSGFRGASPSIFWQLMEALLAYRSALLPYFLLIHLPCSVLCLYIMFSTPSSNVKQKA